VAAGEPYNEETLLSAICEGAALRIRPKAMTVAVVMAGLPPILWGTGTGSEVETRIAAPMVGGMVTAPLLSMLVIPAAWYLLHRRRRMVARGAVFFAGLTKYRLSREADGNCYLKSLHSSHTRGST
jgi:Cu(I)/Ag(I) efflux system membrane protein CusA/SilA